MLLRLLDGLLKGSLVTGNGIDVVDKLLLLLGDLFLDLLDVLGLGLCDLCLLLLENGLFDGSLILGLLGLDGVLADIGLGIGVDADRPRPRRTPRCRPSCPRS